MPQPQFLLKIALACGLVGLLILFGSYLYIQPSMPSIVELRDIRLQTPLRVFSQDEQLLAVYGTKRRIPVRHDDIPLLMRQAFLSAEDARFYKHPGVDYQALLRAAASLVRTGRISQGGSTITMQLARNFYLTRERHFIRKFREIFLALRMETELSKDEILELYLNKIFLGHRAYGIGAAAEVYYGTRPKLLTLAQIATIAGLPKAPSALNPISNARGSIRRRQYVLSRMLEEGFISAEAFQAASEAPATARHRQRYRNTRAPYAGEMIRAEMLKRFGPDAYTAGYTVYSTIHTKLQQAARRAVQRNLIRYDLRHGWRGPIRRLSSLPASSQELDQIILDTPTYAHYQVGVVMQAYDDTAHVYVGRGEWADLTIDEIRWARPHIDANHRGEPPVRTSDVVQTGDVVYLVLKDNRWRLRQVPEPSGALVAMDPNDGAVMALTGGFDFRLSKFNRVTQALRQPGSSFKPFLYSAALAKGYTPSTLINDAPVVYRVEGIDDAWRPENYSGRFYGPTRLRKALIHSRNIVSVRLLDAIGTKYARQYVERFGFDAEALPNNLTLALGSGESTPFEMVTAFTVFANGGYKVEPYLITRIEDARGEVVHEAAPRKVCNDECLKQNIAEDATLGVPEGEAPAELSQPAWMLDETNAPRVLDQRIRYQLVSMLRDVVSQGTARKAAVLERSDLAGKTGTTNDQRDAWFSGFSPHLVATAWIGRDDHERLGKNESGSGAALSTWIDFMRIALDGLPEQELAVPPGIVQARIDPLTGLLARPDADNSLVETFREEQVPNRFADKPLQADRPFDMPEQLF